LTRVSLWLAATWYRRAADRGHTSAMANLGGLYSAGHGVEQDHARANALYGEAVEAGAYTRPLFSST